MIIKKHNEVLKDFAFTEKNVALIDVSYLKSIFQASYYGGGYRGSKLDKKSVYWINKELNTLLDLQESDRLNALINGQGSTMTLDALCSQLEFIQDTLHNIRASFIQSGITEKEEGSCYRNNFNAGDLSRIRHHILSDLVQSLVSINAIAYEETISSIDALSMIRYIAANMLWIIDEAYHSLYLGELTEEEITDVLERKYACRMTEKSTPMLDFSVNSWYRSFARTHS
ncbi:hypothetical protein [Heyndrickxia ginsengihumi]|uniref:hypothetical protein n=1 Tax=Heyndrickxia ginsengihumi TaxID=363870 RepID=UPI002040F236|nr:hypothetical protein [Heyndrickxia ginsengihumi]MCM3024659.1 hypothetical protein [Heyndrickxia ginsengihumi]